MHEIRRRRVLGCIAIVAVVLVAYALNGWQAAPVWSVLADREGAFAAGDPYNEWIYAVCDGEEQQITVLRDGRLEGVSALDSLRTLRFPNWCSSLPTVDNPDLAAWQKRLSELQALTAGSMSAAPILEAAERMPASALYLKPIADWLGDEAHAESFLDTLAERPMRFDHPNGAIARARRSNFSELIERALDVATRGDVTPAQLERWLASAQITSSDQAILKLASLGDMSVESSVMVLQRLEALRHDRRTDVYLSLAPDLVHRGEYAALLRDQLMLLPRQDRLAAARQLLASGDRSVEFPIAMLSGMRRAFGSPDSQLQVFTAIADKLRDEADAPLLLTRHLKDMAPEQRRLAATWLVGLDKPGETTFTMSALGAFGDLHPMSRPKFVYSLMQSPQFDNRSVQEATLLAIQLQVRGPAKEELLAALARHPRLDGDVRSRVNTAVPDPRAERGKAVIL